MVKLCEVIVMYKKKKIILVIFARSNSTRLKNKLFKKIFDKNLLQISINNAKTMRYVDEVIIATTNNISDDKICNIAKNEIKFFRGSENNVLKRLYLCILHKEADYVVRYCCDNYLSQNNFVEDNIRRAVNYNLDVITPGELALTTRGTSQVVLSKSAINEIYKKVGIKFIKNI